MLLAVQGKLMILSKKMKGQSQRTDKTWLQRLESLHPYETLLYLAMIGSGLIFLFLVVAFISSGLHQLEGLNHRMPNAFLISTLLLILSGYTATKMRLYYQEEDIPKLESSLRNTFWLGLAFTVLQIAGWKELGDMGIRFTGIPSGSFLYVLSGIHVLHLVGAMVFALLLLMQLRKTQDDGVQKLLLVTNPYEKMRIRLFTVYWHFMDAVWLVLFLLFILSF
ncbi:cytochrome c oxidase subunit 3 [Algoriphagus sanaruensis]|jgi:cytochrome c oxidase subunit 3|uniref:Cytochrome C oxidase subunit III n=1 Tax=Algoriphagus sanaruensis TaxID=1727163 RepID=A0A142EJV5_9BACT|nr:cytochrome c oxidase subunit 3 [Algoriphagus sanaruensis]AMQ55410.1 cytochrome C oxidase subunit III [Algoriphagus sanaruensis]